MKKFLAVLLALALMIPAFAMGEDIANVVLDYSCDLSNYEGNWVLTGAYTPDGGYVEIADGQATVDLTVMVNEGKLVDEAAYIHADALYLKGTMTAVIDGEEIEYSITNDWSDFPNAIVHGEGDYEQHGAAKVRVRQDDDEIVHFEDLTGLSSEIADEDEEYPSAIGLNAAGQLVLGYSEDHIENDDEAVFEYAFVFTKVVEE